MLNSYVNRKKKLTIRARSTKMYVNIQDTRLLKACVKYKGLKSSVLILCPLACPTNRIMSCHLKVINVGLKLSYLYNY